MKSSRSALACDELLSARLPIDLDASQAKKQEGLAAVNHGASIELGDNLSAEQHFAPRMFHCYGLRHCAHEVATKTYEGTHRTVDDSLASLDRVQALRACRLECILLFELVERRKLRFLGDSD